MAWWDGAWVAVGLLGSFVLGCGPSVDSGGDGDGDTGGASSGDGSDDADSGDTGPIADGPDCAPADAALSLRFEIVGVFGEACVVVDPVDDATISLECEDPDGLPVPGSLVVVAEPPLEIPVPLGTKLAIELVETSSVGEQPLPRYSVFARDAQTNELVFAAVDANDLDWTSALAPLTLDAIDGACAPRPDNANCRESERLMWNATHDGASVPIGDAGRATAGGYTLHVQRAIDGSYLECIDVETDFYEALVVRTG